MLSGEKFKSNFPLKVEIPELLLRLLDYQNQAEDWYSGYFELTGYGRESLIAGFDGDEKAARRFIEFGHSADGSGYAFWLYDDRPLDSAPIVFLGSEGTDNTVLANNLKEFFSLLAQGFEELGFSYGRLEKLQTEENRKFREWLQTELSIETNVDADKIITAARAAHPNLDEWFTSWQEKHFSK